MHLQVVSDTVSSVKREGSGPSIVCSSSIPPEITPHVCSQRERGMHRTDERLRARLDQWRALLTASAAFALCLVVGEGLSSAPAGGMKHTSPSGVLTKGLT